MSHIVFVDTLAGELEKILSGVKCMVVGEHQPSQSPENKIKPGDSLFFLRDNLFFLRDNGERTVRVQATIVWARLIEESEGEDLSRHLKELQTRLHLTEDQFKYWSTRKQVFLINFKDAHKIPAFEIAPEMISQRTIWINRVDR